MFVCSHIIYNFLFPKLHDQVTGNRDTTVECGDKTVAVVAETRQVLGDQISGSSGEQVRACVCERLNIHSCVHDLTQSGILCLQVSEQ